MPRALLSVSDKDGLLPFAQALHERGWALLSTGGTARVLRDAGLPVTGVSEVTGHPEILEGRVKTLHPAVHAGLLARPALEADAEQMRALGYAPIELLVVNLYPFRETIARAGVTDAEAIENIDIGGPAMLRAAAKNHAHVWVVVDPADYPRVLAALDAPAAEQQPLRRELAARVYAHTAGYDAAIATYLRRETPAAGAAEADALPPRLTLPLERVQPLRYGENPEQRAALYAEPGRRGVAGLQQLHGKELSFNNLLDVEGALLAVAQWEAAEAAACAVIKHTTPCGLALGEDAAEAYRKALSTDPTSAFGSVVAFNREVDERAATLLRAQFVEVVVAPAFAPRAMELLGEKKNLRLVTLDVEGYRRAAAEELDLKRVWGGVLAQTRLLPGGGEEGWRVVSRREPTAQEWADLRFAWRAVLPVKSNAILLARDGMTLGIGAGQMSRVDSSRIAVMKAQENGFDLHGAALASDAFFPFRDGVDAAAAAGITAIVQPGGSVRDAETIAAADEHGIAMVFTGRRLFRH